MALADRAVLLQAQHGVWSRAQARRHGVTKSAIETRLRAGRWQVLWPGTYAAFSGPVPRPAALWAALLYAGPESALCGLSAAEVDRLVDRPADARIHLVVPAHRRVRAQPGLRVRRSRRYAETVRTGASPPRTCIEETVWDLIGSARTASEALALAASACQRRLTTADRLARTGTARRNVRWRPVVLAGLLDIGAGGQSLLELRYLGEVERAHGLPTGRRQRAVRRGPGREWTDVAYEEYATVIELDGRTGHDGPRNAWRDMRRDNAAVVAGEAPLRYGWADVTERPCRVAAEVAAVLGARGWTGQARRCGNLCTL